MLDADMKQPGAPDGQSEGCNNENALELERRKLRQIGANELSNQNNDWQMQEVNGIGNSTEELRGTNV